MVKHPEDKRRADHILDEASCYVEASHADTQVLDVDWLIENKVTSVVLDERTQELIINPRLEDYQFFKVMDAYTTYQELHQLQTLYLK